MTCSPKSNLKFSYMKSLISGLDSVTHSTRQTLILITKSSQINLFF